MSNGSAVLLFKDDKRNEIFLVRRTDYPLWVETGGGMEKGETPPETALREAQEETGFEVKLGKQILKYSVVNKSGKEIRKEYIFDGRIVSGIYKPEFKGNIGKWFLVDKLPFNISRATKTRLHDAKKYTNTHGIVSLKRKSESPWDYKYLIPIYPLFALKLLIKVMFNK